MATLTILTEGMGRDVMGSCQSVIRKQDVGRCHATCPMVFLGQKVQPPAKSKGGEEGPELGK